MSTRPSVDEVRHWVGLIVQDSNGDELGRCIRAYRDDETGQTEWLVIESGGGSAEHFVPTRDARREDAVVRVAWVESVVLASPPLGSPDQVSNEDEGRLYAHYGIPTPAQDLEGQGGGPASPGQGASGRRRLVRLAATPDETDSGTPAASETREEPQIAGPAAVLDASPAEAAQPGVAPDAPAAPAAEAPAPAAPAPTPAAEAPTPAPAASPPPAASPEQQKSKSRVARTAAVLVPLLAAGAAGALRWRRSRQQAAAQQRAKLVGSAAGLLVPAAAAVALLLRRRRRSRSEQWQTVAPAAEVPAVVDLEQERGLRSEPAAPVDVRGELDIPTVRDPDALR